jgi:DNA adenine methylase
MYFRDTTTAEVHVKPYLKWAGGKSRLAGRIRSHLNTTDKPASMYVEPFCGALGVFLERAAQGEIESAILADANQQLIETHLAVQRNLDLLLEELDKLPWDETYTEHYYELRDRYNAIKDAAARRTAQGYRDGIERAALFIWLNKACFNGLHRVNKRGAFNVPVGKYKKPSRPTETELRAVSDALQCATLVRSDFRELPGLKSPLDLYGEPLGVDQVYFDPPYAPLTPTADFTAYTKGGFDYRCQMQLALMCAELADRGVRVVASNHDVPEVSGMYERLGFCIHRIEVQRSVGASGQTRKKVGEILAVR